MTDNQIDKLRELERENAGLRELLSLAWDTLGGERLSAYDDDVFELRERIAAEVTD